MMHAILKLAQLNVFERVSIALCASVCIAFCCHAQAPDPDLGDLRFADLFHCEIRSEDGHVYLLSDPDSMRGNLLLEERCTALWAYNSYLFENYADVYGRQTELIELLPDTGALLDLFNMLIGSDTAFESLYKRSVRREMVAPLSIDSALIIASHFFYLHRVRGSVTGHICIGINKVKDLLRSTADIYHAAFCFMAIRDTDDPYSLFTSATAPLTTELKEGPSDERMLELEGIVYDSVANDPRLKKALLDAFEMKGSFVNFELIH